MENYKTIFGSFKHNTPNNLKLVRAKIYCPLIVARIVKDNIAIDDVLVQASHIHHGLEGEEDFGASMPVFSEIISFINSPTGVRKWIVRLIKLNKFMVFKRSEVKPNNLSLALRMIDSTSFLI